MAYRPGDVRDITHVKRARRQVRERDLDLHPMMLGVGKTEVIGDRRLRKRRAAGKDENNCGRSNP